MQLTTGVPNYFVPTHRKHSTTTFQIFSIQLELSKIRLYYSIEVIELYLERTRRRIWAGFTKWVVDVPWEKNSILRIFGGQLELSKIRLYHSIEVIKLYLERWLGALERTRRRIWAGFTKWVVDVPWEKNSILRIFGGQLELSKIRLYHSIDIIELYLERWLGALERTRRRIWAGFTKWVVDVPWEKNSILRIFGGQSELSKIRLYHSIEVIELYLERWLGALERTRRRIWAGFTKWVVDVPWEKNSILRIFGGQLELSKIRLYHSIEVIKLYLERWLGALERTRRRIWAGFTKWVVDVPWEKNSILRIFGGQLELSKIRLYHSIDIIELYLERWLGALERTRRRIWAGFTKWVVDVPWEKNSILRIFGGQSELSKIRLYYSIEVIELYLERWLGALERTRRRIWAGFT